MTFTPMPGRVLVRLLDDKKEIAGLIIPEKRYKDQEPILKAKVLYVGKWIDRVKPGDQVLIQGHAGQWVDESVFGDRATYRIVDEDEMVAKVS